MKFDDAKPQVGKDSVRLEDLVDLLKFPKKQFVSIRILDHDIMPMKQHWINIIAGKDRREVNIPKLCVSFDPSTEADKDGVVCPYCALEGKRDDFKYLANAIIREEQENKPRKAKDPSGKEAKSGFKDPSSESWTPVRVLRLPSSLLKKIQELKQLNKARNKKTDKTEAFSVAHPKYGCDIAIKFDPDAKGGDMYQVQLQDRTPLTDEEKEFLIYELSEELIEKCGRETPQQAKKELAKMEIVGQDKLDAEDEDDEDEPKSKKKKSKSKKVKDEDDDIDLDDDEDEDEPKSKKKSKKSREEDDDEDLDEDEDEPKSKKKSKKSRDDDDEDDEPKKKKKKKSRDDDEDDDDIPF